MATDETTSTAIDVSQPAQQRPPTAAERRAKEHAGTTDTEVLARDIEQTREELSVTIDAIVDRVSPKKVVERSKQQAREGVHDATEIVKVHATTAAGVVREKALVASEVVKVEDRRAQGQGVRRVRLDAGAQPAGVGDLGAPGERDAGLVSRPRRGQLARRLAAARQHRVRRRRRAAAAGARADDRCAGRRRRRPRPAGRAGRLGPALPPPGAGRDLDRPAGRTPVPGAAALLAAVLLLLRRRSARRRTRVVRRR